MIFYVLAGAVTALVVAVLLRPLMRRVDEREAGAQEDIEVYKSQLEELDRDVAAGTMEAGEAETVRREVERRILAADAKRRTTARSGRPARRWALVVMLSMLFGGPAIYLWIGEPGEPAFPYASREDVQVQRDLLERAEALRSGLVTDPSDVASWRELAFLRLILGQPGAAIEALQQVIGRGGGDSEIYATLAEALIRQAEGRVTPEARQMLAQSMRLNANEPLALYYVGHALEQDGRFDLALDLWRDMAAALPEGSRWQARLSSDIDRVAAKAEADQ